MATGCCGGGETLIFTCAGAAYCGQLANRVGVQLMQQGLGRLFCIAAVAAGIADKLVQTRQARLRLVLDGCDDQCARKVLEKTGLHPDQHVVLTGLGIEKSPAQPNMISDTKKVLDYIKQSFSPATVRPARCCTGSAAGNSGKGVGEP